MSRVLGDDATVLTESSGERPQGHAIEPASRRWRGDAPRQFDLCAASNIMKRQKKTVACVVQILSRNGRGSLTRRVASRVITTTASRDGGRHRRDHVTFKFISHADSDVVVGHLKIPSTTAAEDEQRGTGEDDRFTQEKKMSELHRAVLEALCGMDTVATLSPCARETRRLSCNHIEVVEAVWSHEHAIDAT